VAVLQDLDRVPPQERSLGDFLQVFVKGLVFQFLSWIFAAIPLPDSKNEQIINDRLGKVKRMRPLPFIRAGTWAKKEAMEETHPPIASFPHFWGCGYICGPAGKITSP
jgi:hypothetical protein